MSEEVKGGNAERLKTRMEARKNLTLADLQTAVDTINSFATMYRKAKMAMNSLERAEGKAGVPSSRGGAGGMFGGMGNDPFTGMMMGAVEEAVKHQATKMVEKKTAGMKVSDSVGELTAEEIAEAQGGLEGGSEEGEESKE